MSDTLTVRKTPSEEEDARRRREGDGERGEKSVGAFSETAATEVIRPCIAERERERGRLERSQQSEMAKEEQEREGRAVGAIASPLRCHSRMKLIGKREGSLSICHLDAENLISIIVTVTVAAPSRRLPLS